MISIENIVKESGALLSGQTKETLAIFQESAGEDWVVKWQPAKSIPNFGTIIFQPNSHKAVSASHSYMIRTLAEKYSGLPKKKIAQLVFAGQKSNITIRDIELFDVVLNQMAHPSLVRQMMASPEMGDRWLGGLIKAKGMYNINHQVNRAKKLCTRALALFDAPAPVAAKPKVKKNDSEHTSSPVVTQPDVNPDDYTVPPLNNTDASVAVVPENPSVVLSTESLSDVTIDVDGVTEPDSVEPEALDEEESSELSVK